MMMPTAPATTADQRSSVARTSCSEAGMSLDRAAGDEDREINEEPANEQKRNCGQAQRKRALGHLLKHPRQPLVVCCILDFRFSRHVMHPLWGRHQKTGRSTLSGGSEDELR